MRHASRTPKALVLLAAAGLFAVAVAQAFAEDAQDGERAQHALEAGVSAYQEGALEFSVETLSSALEGDLSRQEIAEALYYRGLAYRELGKPGQAISDLTTAISVKNGLSKAHLKDAVKNRAGAYREAGIMPTESAVVTESSLHDYSRVPVSTPAGRLPVPVAAAPAAPRQPEPPATSAETEAAPAPGKGDFVAAIQKLIPDWP